MTMPAPPARPGLADRVRRHQVLRLVGTVLAVVGVVLMGISLADLYGAFDQTLDVVDVAGLPGEVRADNGPTLFWLGLLGLPLALVGGALAVLGYVTGNADDEHAEADEDAGPVATATGPFCRSCGARNDSGARFCDSCGAALA